YLSLPIVFLLAAEYLVLALSLYAGETLALSYSSTAIGGAPMWFEALLYAFTTTVCLMAMGLYSVRMRAGPFGIAVRIGVAVAASVLAATLGFYFFPATYLSVGTLAGTAALSVIGVSATRLVFYRIVDEDLFKRRVLVLGAGQRVSSILQLRRRSDQRGFHIVGFISAAGDRITVAKDKLLDKNGSMLELVRKHRVDEIVVAQDDRRQEFPLQELLDCRLEEGTDITDLMNFLERETGKVQLDVMSPSWFIFSDGFHRSDFGDTLKRVFDLVAATLLLVLLLPVIALVYLGIKFTDGFRQPAFYSQRRVGLSGEIFTIRKFRSMTVDAEQDGKAQWATANDARVTRLGSFLRKSRLDEVPQLFNVLTGDMSFVGPRPERPEFVSHLNQVIPYYRERHCVKPGITGWAQLCYPYGASEQDAMEKLKYDMYYAKNQGLMFDLAILLQTVEVVLWGKGAR
ncbi:MAG: TIGR03013 family PEP-CTERM/XrtA system glycosyltransferase, partial [Xanthomonadales bacterium]|nr:TIGR03013 family PEP-CTERM/XrtA system glycosyltransferase [Xanthomonadales bacterium]